MSFITFSIQLIGLVLVGCVLISTLAHPSIITIFSTGVLMIGCATMYDNTKEEA